MGWFSSKKSSSNEPIVPRVQGNSVIVCSPRGGEIYRFTPTFGGGAVYVDVHPRTNRMLVTVQDGHVGLYEGTAQIQIYNIQNAETACWTGDDVLVKHKDGRTILYSKNGGWIREFQ